MKTTATAEFRFLGTTDEVTTCECCGKTGLKSTVAIEADGGAPMYFGITCAARALGRKVVEIKAGARAADRAAEEAASAARAKADSEARAPWFAFLAARGVGDDVFRRIGSLGGYAIARELFRASQAVAS